MHDKRIGLCAFTLFFLSAIICRADWRADLPLLLNAEDKKQQEILLDRILAENPDASSVAEAIRNISFPQVEKTGGTIIGSARCKDGKRRPYVLYIPPGYDPGVPTPLLLYLHGGVGRKNIVSDPVGYASKNPFLPTAGELGWLVLFPFGQHGATWFDNVGIQNVLNQIRIVKHRYNVDDDRVWMAGFSDGASASFSFCMLHPSDFSSFVALNGSMGVGNQDEGLPTYASNLSAAPVYVVNTDLDELYPASEMRKTIEMARGAGAQVFYKEYFGIKHSLDYIEKELPRIARFLHRHPRDPFRPDITWKASDPAYGQNRWFRIGQVAKGEPAPWHRDANITLTDRTVLFGFMIDYSYKGDGLAVERLVDGDTPARLIGLAAGDVIVECNEMRIRNDDDFETFRMSVQRGDSVRMVVLRDGKQVILSADLPEPKDYPLFKQEKPAAAAVVRFMANKINIKGSRLGGFTVLVHPDMIQLDRELEIEVNGKTVFKKKVRPDIEFLLRNFLKNRDRSLLYVNEVKISLPVTQ